MVIVAPPVTPAPAATPFTGRWSGSYIIERCDGTGSVQDLLCGTRRGLFPPGTSLPLDLDLTQTGSNVSGTIALGQITGVVNGAVRINGLLTLSGVARSGTATATLTFWDTRATGSVMDGFFNFNATYVDIPESRRKCAIGEREEVAAECWRRLADRVPNLRRVSDHRRRHRPSVNRRQASA